MPKLNPAINAGTVAHKECTPPGCTFVLGDMSCRVEDICLWLDERFPTEEAEPWDKVGLLVGDPDSPVSAVVVALDPTLQALQVAEDRGAALLVTHHPLWLDPPSEILSTTPMGAVIWRAIRGGISIYCAHTNVDRHSGGLNDLVSGKLALFEVRSFAHGMGRIGQLDRPSDQGQLLRRIMDAFPDSIIKTAGGPKDKINAVAVCCGSGASLIQEACVEGADVLITGDVKYHDARKAQALGIWVVDVGHFALEKEFVPWMADLLRQNRGRTNCPLEVIPFLDERDPFDWPYKGP